jgi:diguanylate cyclase (GGDEF)-like protein
MDAAAQFNPRIGLPLVWPTRERVLSLGIITLVFAMVAISIAGFAHITMQQQSLVALREQSREVQAIHQALTKADADVLYVVRGDSSRLRDYFGSLDVLKSSGDTLARIDAAQPADPGAPSVPELVDTLRAAWGRAVELATAGETGAAEAVLVEASATGAAAAIGTRIAGMLKAADAQFPLHESRITVGTLLVLLLQVGSGTLAILGLIHAFRASRHEAAGRVEAVLSANRSREQVGRLFEMADVLQSAADHTDANAVLEATATDLVPGFPGALYVFNNSRDRLVLSSSWGQENRDALPETINPNSCWAVKRGKPHTNRSDGGKLCCDHHTTGQAVLEIPMVARGEIVGLFQLFAEGANAEARLQSVIDLGSALADGMSLALANIALREKLRNQALRDALTGLYNRRYMEDTLQRFVRIAGRENRDISLVMIDLDHFKRLNDERGHAFGDQVLRDTAVTLVNNLRETDVICRYGGEELVVLLPDCPVERAADKAEALRQRIHELSPALGAEISASFGVACVPHTSQGVSDLLAAADSALYKAKQNGRNQVVVAPLRPYGGEREDPAPAADRVKLQAAE